MDNSITLLVHQRGQVIGQTVILQFGEVNIYQESQFTTREINEQTTTNQCLGRKT
jgi:hypothetical protein